MNAKYYLADYMTIVYGGAFNPPTIAHFDIVKKLKTLYPLAKIIILPVGNYYKKDELIDFKHRFNMLKLLFKDYDNIIISDLENTNNFLGTINSLNELSKKYDNIHLVIGADNLVNIDTWIKVKDLLSNYPLIVFKRDNISNNNINELLSNIDKYNAKYRVLEFDHIANSSEIRMNVNKNKKWLTNEVYEYIIKNKLYEVK